MTEPTTKTTPSPRPSRHGLPMTPITEKPERTTRRCHPHAQDAYMSSENPWPRKSPRERTHLDRMAILKTLKRFLSIAEFILSLLGWVLPIVGYTEGLFLFIVSGLVHLLKLLVEVHTEDW